VVLGLVIAAMPACVGGSARPGLTARPAEPVPPPTPRAPAPDDWIATDKLRHFFVSYGVTAFGYGASRTVGIDDGSSLPLAIGSAALAGLVKEIADVRGGGPFSVKDLVWDVGGIASAVAILRAAR
jgi:uncharacterized protein YfiM (DUF2279 family)